MEYGEFRETFPIRTWNNLILLREIHSGQKKVYDSPQEAASAQKNETELYEITQLINSLLGLLVFFKAFRYSVPNKPLSDYTENRVSELSASGSWEEIPRCSLRDIFRHLRNAIAHGNIIPLEVDSEVTGFEFQDRIDNNSSIYWKLQLENPAIWKIAEDLKNVVFLAKQ